MKRFCIFLITGTVVIFLFLILAILFKGIGLYIAMAVIATIFLILSSIILYGVLKLRKCNFYLQNYDVEPIIKSYKFLSKILFSKDDINELYLYMSMVYSLKNDSKSAKIFLDSTSRHSMKTSRMLYLYYCAYRLYYICLNDVDNYNSIANEFFSLSENLYKTIANEFLLGTEMINLSNLIYKKVRIEDIKDNLDFSSEKPLLIDEFYNCFLEMIKINDYQDFTEKSFKVPLVQSLYKKCLDNFNNRRVHLA